MLIGFRSAASVVDQQRKSKHKKHKVPSRKIKRFQPEGRVHGVWIRSHQKGGRESALTVHTLSSLRGGGCVVDHDVVCVYGYRSQWYMAVGCSFTDISGLACYNYLLVVTVFSAPPLSRWSCSARRGRVKRKGRDASEQLQPFHTPATKSATTTVDMMRKDEGEEGG